MRDQRVLACTCQTCGSTLRTRIVMPLYCFLLSCHVRMRLKKKTTLRCGRPTCMFLMRTWRSQKSMPPGYLATNRNDPNFEIKRDKDVIKLASHLGNILGNILGHGLLVVIGPGVVCTRVQNSLLSQLIWIILSHHCHKIMPLMVY